MSSSATDTVDTSDVKPIVKDFDEEAQRAPAVPPTMTIPATNFASFRVKCGHCRDIFHLSHNWSCIARCPHCQRTSPVGADYARKRANIFGILAFVFLAAGIGVTVGTYEKAKTSGGMYVVWIGAFVAGIINLIISFYYGTMTVSSIEGEQ